MSTLMKWKKHSVIVLLIVFLLINATSIALAANASVHFEKKSDYLEIGDEYKLSLLTANEKKISSSKVDWASSKKDVATVSKKGVITGHSLGKAKITATYKGKKYTFTIQVSDTHLKFEEKTVTLGSATKQVLYTFDNEVIPNIDLIWSSTDENIATVDENGLITAKAEGQATVLCQTAEDVYESIITVKAPTLKKSTIGVGEIVKKNLYDVNGKKIKKGVTWKSSDEAVVKVNSNGEITGVAEGKATLEAVYGECVSSATITVVDSSDRTHLYFTESDLTIGFVEDAQHLITDLGEEISNKKVKWKSDDSTIASISSNGKITAKDFGTTTLTASYKNKKYIFRINVVAPTLRYDALTLNIADYRTQCLYGSSYDSSGASVSSEDVSYKSSNPKIVQVNSTGKIKGIKPGKATVTACYMGYEFPIDIVVSETENTKSWISKNTSSDNGAITSKEKTLVSMGKARLKSVLYYPTTLEISAIYLGTAKYPVYGAPTGDRTVIIEYSALNGLGARLPGYFFMWESDDWNYYHDNDYISYAFKDIKDVTDYYL